MKGKMLFWGIVTLFLILVLVNQAVVIDDSGESKPATPDLKYTDREILIKFRPQAGVVIGQALPSDTLSMSGPLVFNVLTQLDTRLRDLLLKRGVQNLRPLFRFLHHQIKNNGVSAGDLFNQLRNKYSRRSNRSLLNPNPPKIENIYILEFSNKIDVENLVKELKENLHVEYVEPNYIYKTTYVPTDPLYSQQWAHQKTNIESAWDIQLGSSDTVIAIIDTGVAYNHEDLAANIWKDVNQNPGRDFVDVDTAYYQGLGYTLIPEEDYIDIDNDPSDYYGHGTHCAGIVGAVEGNGLGVVGVCPGSRIMPVRAGFALRYGSNDYGVLENDDVAASIYYAAEQGADVISMSFGGQNQSSVIKDALDYAESLGVFLVAAAGNSNTSSLHYPAGFDNVMAVGATAIDNTRSYYSNYGLWVDVFAPGGDQYKDSMILSTVPLTGTISDPSGYRSIQGTSMACPYVAGLAALIISERTDFSTYDIRGALIMSAVDLGEVGRDKVYSYGLVDGSESIQKAQEGPQPFLTAVRIQEKRGSDLIPFFPTPGDENLLLVITLKNEWTSASNVIATLTSSDPYLQIVSGQSQYGDIASQAEVNNIATPFSINIASNCPYEYSINCSLNLQGDGAFSQSFPVLLKVTKKVIIYQVLAGIGAPAVVGDVTGNGKKEICFTSLDGFIHLIDDKGENLPGWPKPFPISSTPEKAIDFLARSVPALGDINNDGVFEIVGHGSHYLYVWEVTDLSPNPKKEIQLIGNIQTNGTAGSPVLADLDNNGMLEILVQHGNYLYVFAQDGSPFPGLWPMSNNYALGNCATPAVADLDKNGDLEILFTETYEPSNEIKFYVLNHDGTTFNSSWPKNVSSLSNVIHASPIAVDIDSDGILDVMFNINNNIYLFDIEGNLKYNWPYTIPSHSFAIPCDLNGDGFLEIATAHPYVHSYLIDYQGQQIWQRSLGSTGFCAWSPASGDVDGDGIAEYLMADGSGIISPRVGKIRAWNYNGTNVGGEFPIDTGIGMHHVVLDDIDQNNKLDLVWTDIEGNVFYYKSDAPYNQETMFWPQFQHDARHTGCIPVKAIDVTSPNGTGIWTLGELHPITWKRTGQMIDTVKIRLRTADGSKKLLDIANNTPNDEEFEWTLPEDIHPGQYTIRVATTDGQVVGDSEAFLIAATGSPQIVVISPAIGATWKRGEIYGITWFPIGTMNDNVKIRLRTADGSTKILNISNSTPNNNSFLWAVPADLTPGQYTIRVATVDGQVVGDSTAFNITTSGSTQITVVSPAIGTTWERVQTHDITWVPEGTMNNDMKIRLRTADGSTKVLNISNSTSNNGNYRWPIPADLALGQYSIRVATVDAQVIGDSAVFTITAAGSPRITVTSPESGVNWERGQTYDITWVPEGTMNNSVKIRLRTADGRTKVLNISNLTLNNGIFQWPIPADLAPGQYSIRVATVDAQVIGDSQPFFVTN